MKLTKKIYTTFDKFQKKFDIRVGLNKDLSQVKLSQDRVIDSTIDRQG